MMQLLSKKEMLNKVHLQCSWEECISVELRFFNKIKIIKRQKRVTFKQRES